MPVRPLQAVCGPVCALTIAKVAGEERKRLETRQNRERLKTRAELIREAQAVFNRWIRARDADLPCISCGRHHNGQYHAGHYRTTKAAPQLRFDPANVHKQCQPCNTHLSGNIVEYRRRLIDKIGISEVERIENDNTSVKWDRENLLEIKRLYKTKK